MRCSPIRHQCCPLELSFPPNLPASRQLGCCGQVKDQYYPEVKEMLKRVTGATRVEIFDHTLRSGHIAEDG